MYVHESGPVQGPVVVFLHGDGTNGTMWVHHLNRLKDYHCLAPDDADLDRYQSIVLYCLPFHQPGSPGRCTQSNDQHRSDHNFGYTLSNPIGFQE